MPLELFSRRSFLTVGALSFFGWFRWAEALALRSQAPTTQHEDLSIILIWLAGGISQFETWDPKPEADDRFRGRFGAIPTNVPGILIGEHLPLTAKIADKYVIIRSMTHKDAVHESAQAYLLSGHPPLPTLSYPAVGSIITRELPNRNELPPYVLTGGPPAAWEQAAFLGPDYNPFVAGDPNTENFQVRDLDLPLGVDWARMERRNSLRTLADHYFRQFDTSQVIDTLDVHYQTALNLISSDKAKAAFDIAAEPENDRERYGRTSLGQGCLLARRLVEAGVRFISVRGTDWDHHADIFNILSRRKLPELDRAFSTLVHDLEERGLLDTTLVILGTEFGRTPEINVNNGRDHWPNAFSVVLAGGGISGGRVIGATDPNCMTVTERPVHVEELLATQYRLLGIDHRKVYETSIGRPVRLVSEPYRPMRELLA